MSRKITRFALIFLLWIYFSLGMVNIRQASVTFDEGPHLAIGYATLKTGDFRLQPVHIHPPLANVLAALPLLLQPDLPAPADIGGWQINSLSSITNAIVWQYPDPAHIATAARSMILLSGLVLAAVIFRWANIMGGRLAGHIALILFVFDPNIVAHSSLVTTDIFVTCLSTVTLFSASRYLVPAASKNRQRLHFILTGIYSGLALLSKVSAIALFPVLGLVFLCFYRFMQRQPTLDALIKATYQTVLLVIIAFVVVWMGYGFEVSQPEGFPFPLPAGTQWAIYRSLTQHYELGHPSFAIGRISTEGWWWYFPLAFVIKTPFPILIFLLTGLLASFYLLKHKNLKIPSNVSGSMILLLSWVIFYAVTSLFSSVNIGYRHLLPLLPCLYILTATSLSAFWKEIQTHKPVKYRKIVLWSAQIGFWSLVFAMRHSLPSSLSYFNWLAGGQQLGYRYLVDSNLDWGQNLWDLQKWMQDNHVETVKYAHYSPANPAQYGIQVEFLPPDPRAVEFTPWHPEPGIYVIGATVLEGVYTPDVNTYAYFRSQRPIARLGGALFIYQVAEYSKPDWVVGCEPDPADATIQRMITNLNLRVVHADCRSVNVFPASNQYGLYITSPDQAVLVQGFHDFDLKQEDDQVWRSIYRVYQSTEPQFTIENQIIQGPLEFMGYSVDAESIKPGQLLELTTYWYVAEVPDRPLSLLAHLVSSENTLVATGDAMGYPIEYWLPGDVITQRHYLKIPDDAVVDDKFVIITGGYWLDTMERWTTGKTDNVLVLDTLTVREY